MPTNKSGVLIIAPPNDAHSLMVKRMLELKFNQKVWIWDSSLFPKTTKVNLITSGTETKFFLKENEELIDLSRLRSIWWRRKFPPSISDMIIDDKIKKYCIRESTTFLNGFLDSLDVPIINKPAAQNTASNKPLQLNIAQKIGLNIPRTIMTNDPEHVTSFWNEMKRNCIYKAFTSPEGSAIETRMLTQDALENLKPLCHAPIIVQEKIDAGVDIRINVFGEKIFAGELTTKHPDAQIDWRIDLTAKFKTHLLPENIKNKVIQLVKALDLDYGCIDMRRLSNGSYVFFEINPSGQFLFIEVDTGQPHCEAMAELLLSKI